MQYILQNGLQDLSLRPLAQALGTNARMLLYHFGSKERLIVEALGRLQERQRSLLAQSLETSAPSDSLRAVWRLFTSSPLAPYVRLVFEIEALGIQGNAEYKRFAQEALGGWVELLHRRLPGSTPAHATLVLGAFEGLLLDWLVTHDEERVNAAFELLIELLGQKGEQ